MASIQERGAGHFRITVCCGSYPNGKKHTETTTFSADSSLTSKQQRKAAEEFARRFEDKIHASNTLDGRKTTLRDFAERWLEEYAKLHLQPKTIEKYKEELDDKIIPALGRMKLSDLKPSTLNTFFVSLTKDGVRKDGRKGGYARGSLYKTKNVLSSMLRSAVEWEIIDANPCSKVRLPTLPSTADTIKFFTPEQTIAFLKYIEEPYTVKVQGHERTDDTGKKYTVGDYDLHKQIPEQLIILFNLAVYGGFRKGELLALKFSDFDFVNCSVSISKSVTVHDGKQICKSPKTRSSVRNVSLPKVLIDRIAQLYKTRKTDKAIWGSEWKGDEWLFITNTGDMMNYSTPYQALQDAIHRYNQGKAESEQLPLIPFHGLRHTSATLLISSNQDIATVSRRLGHAHTSVTLDIYTHALPKSDRNASEALEGILENPRN